MPLQVCSGRFWDSRLSEKAYKNYSNRMLKIIKNLDPRTFLDTYEEWHAFIIGFCEAMCPWKPRIEPTKLQYLQAEWHYYVFGRALGFMALFSFVIGIVKAIWA